MSAALSFNPTWHSKRQYDIFYCGARYIVVPGGRRSGKTTGGLTHAAHMGLTRPGIKMLWVDTTQGNIDKYVSEILLPMLPKESYSWNRQQKVLRFTSGAIMHFGSAERPENLEGFGYQIIYLNEAGIILKGASGERLWHNTLKPMTIEEKDGNKCQVFFIGTPKGRGLFKEFAEKGSGLDGDWRTFRLSTYDNPLIPRAEIDALVRETPGKIAFQEIYGEFIDEDDDEPVIPLAMTLAALEREATISKDYFPVWGVDVARGGHDRSVLVRRRWKAIEGDVLVWRGLDTVQLAEAIRQIFLATPKEDRPFEILVDETGIGAGVVDYGRRIGLPIRGIVVARKPRVERRFTQLRDELWWAARTWMETGSLKGADELAKELARPVVDRKTLDNKGLWKVEAKDVMERRLGSIEGRSPDLADAFVLTFASGIERRVDHARERDYGRNHEAESNYSFMGA